MNCSTHKNKPAVGTCDACGAGLCQSCYEDFDIASTGEHLCPNCYRAVIVDEIEQVKPIRGMVIRELIIMIIGMIAGLVIGLDMYFGFGILFDEGTYIPVFPLYLPFVGGSLISIVKKIIYFYRDNKDSSGADDAVGNNVLTILIAVVMNVLIAPIMTTIRLIQRISDVVKVNAIMKEGNTLLSLMEKYL